ncbi:hypothetical protein ACFXPA_29145 [Amycolatopsis sp. NPDC059090]|uniref:hypothetical protein n=1 Tax=Amycolatopsis sp. NPDC059090 TaxID=3346723 RepID=UPI00366CB50B
MKTSRNLFLCREDRVETSVPRRPLRQRWSVVVAADGTRRLEASWHPAGRKVVPAESWYAETA